MTNTSELLADHRDKAYERLLALCGTRSDAPRWDDIGTLLREREELQAALRQSAPSLGQPSVVDFDDGEISVRLNGNELRGWSYKNDTERRVKMLAAREYVEGYCDGRGA